MNLSALAGSGTRKLRIYFSSTGGLDDVVLQEAQSCRLASRLSQIREPLFVGAYIQDPVCLGLYLHFARGLSPEPYYWRLL